MTDFPEPRAGKVTLLVGDYDPPTMDYVRAVDSISLERGGSIWLCPVSPEDKPRAIALAMAFSTELSSSRKTPMTCCTVAVDKGIDGNGLLSWCKSRYPGAQFELASLEDVSFAGEAEKGMRANKFLRVGGGIRERISRGSDESRTMTPGTWSLILARGYYR